MTQLGLITPPALPEPRDRPGMTAEDVKDALRRHHSASPAPMPGEWTVVEELWGVDLLAWSAWNSSQHRRHGYEVKVSRSDYRRELLKPAKRSRALKLCHRFSFAVPAGLLTADELAYVEPIWDDGAFQRKKCPEHCIKAQRAVNRHSPDRYAPRRGTVAKEQVPVPAVIEVASYSWRFLDALAEDSHIHRLAEREGISTEEYVTRERERSLTSYVKQQGWTHRPCPACGGKGYVKGARVEEEAPTLWVPADVGLVEVHAGGVRVVKRPPANDVEPLSESQMAEAFRWASLRGDPRHRRHKLEAIA